MFFFLLWDYEMKIKYWGVFFFIFWRERGYDKTMEDEEEGEGRVWSREKEREGRRDVVVIGK